MSVAAVGTTGTLARVPKPCAENVTVPVGPAPKLVVLIVAVNCTGVVVVLIVVFEVKLVVVGAAVTVIASTFDGLGLKLLSPEYAA